MKKVILMAAAILAASTAISAQVQVDSLSRLIVGDRGGASFVEKGETPEISPLSINNNLIIKPLEVDPAAKICVLGNGKNGSGGRISFGSGSNVFIQENMTAENEFEFNTLQLYGSSGVSILGRDKKEASTYNLLSNKHIFYCDVTVDGLFVNSDSRLKSDIEELSDTDKALAAINAVSYSLCRGNGDSGVAKMSADGSQSQPGNMAADPRTRFGFVAQQVKEVFPELVAEDENGYLSVDYIGFIPLLVDAVNNLSAKVEEQQQIIDSLGKGSMKKAGVDEGIYGPALSQNRPNPFSKSTVIECTLPSDVAEAALYIYDMQGKQLLRIPVTERGKTSVTVEARQLGAGMYIYALVADGQEIDSRRMIVNE